MNDLLTDKIGNAVPDPRRPWWLVFQGFDTARLDAQAAPGQGGYGLQGLRERLEMVRGQMSITSDRQTGTEITVVVPKHLAQVAAT